MGDGQQLAIDVCAAVERHVFSLFVFGNDGVECDPSDSVIRSGAVAKVQVHRDCPSLRRDTSNLQFVAVLQGRVEFRIETTVDALLPPRTDVGAIAPEGDRAWSEPGLGLFGLAVRSQRRRESELCARDGMGVV